MKITVIALASLLFTFTQSTDVDSLVERLDAYLAAYEPKLSELIADEVMQQQVPRAAAARVRDTLPPSALERRRRLISEVAFIALPEAGWLGFRHVKSVNNQSVEDTAVPLSAALQKSSYDAARELLESSAAHNLGLPRTTNLPNLPLHFLHRRNRSRMLVRADGEERVRGVKTDRIVMHERLTPTLIRNPTTGGDMPSTVRAWIDPRDGRLLRAEVRTFKSPFAMQLAENTVRVEFANNRALQMLVPIEMREQFPITLEYHGTSVARYSNFRRFTTSARIIPQ